MAAAPIPPTTTFVIPCFNHGRWVAEAARSCLAQVDADGRAIDTRNLEVIVIDDGSDDGTTPQACDALEPMGVRVVHQPNAGLPASRNAGAAMATSEFLVFLDADDWVEPTFLIRLHDALAANADASHAYCQERLTDLGQGVIWRVPKWDPVLLLVTNLHPVTCLIRKERFESVSGFDASMTQGYEDWDLWLKLATKGWHGVRVREPLFNWRRHSASTMIDDAVSRHDELYRRLLHAHNEFFAQHAVETAACANSILRRADCHWIDETGTPIELQYLHAVRDAYHTSAAVSMAKRFGVLLDRTPRSLRSALRRFVVGTDRRNDVRHPTTYPDPQIKTGRP